MKFHCKYGGLKTGHRDPQLPPPRIGDIRIPNVKEAFREILDFDPERISTKRERVIANILVDIYMLCDLEWQGVFGSGRLSEDGFSVVRRN